MLRMVQGGSFSQVFLSLLEVVLYGESPVAMRSVFARIMVR
ncbi:hypothetical protein B0I08_10932 [Glaciihabitans tibetensis]|uniref:Uncharacterized protein n=1 Tax=Glaciihabitans tibetensis TaxID=1266600 RepID=A0A2T0V6W0_9MICO|nr:hypothetical protein B0I08_10932 [Glaciihabitans tibetensis]